MTDTPDYSSTLFLPRTDFPMRAGLPQKEPEILRKWQETDLYGQLRAQAQGRQKFILHDGPPYANGNIHIGHALNKILKDIVTRSQQMLGYDSNYVPGWDCHGLPIEWKIEEEYRAKGRNKDAIDRIEFRGECRTFAQGWVDVQRDEFRRLGVIGDWKQPYLTMSFDAEACIAREVMKFAMTDQLYRGSKPVMWSVVEKTALAEAEIEYYEHTSDAIYVKFPIKGTSEAALKSAGIVIWTTTPWTLPGNRAISFSSKVRYGLYEITAAPEENWLKAGERLILADTLAEAVLTQGRVESWWRLEDVSGETLSGMTCAHPLHALGYSFPVPLLEGDHVTDDTGTGFVHTAPGHGLEDYKVWMDHAQDLRTRGISTAIPYTVDGDGTLTDQAPAFAGRQVMTGKGEKGDANEAVIEALKQAGMLLGRSRLKHQYPHSWRSKKPVIFRNTPQWFIAMDTPLRGHDHRTLRQLALAAIEHTRWVPPQGENRITGMIETRPDWVVSRQRAWGVPICVFMKENADGTVVILKDEAVNARIIDAFSKEGADAWYAPDASARFLGGRASEDWQKVEDILDVWFDSGCTHAFTLEQREDLKPGPGSTVMYLEGSDQHRGWFHSSLLESCGTRGRAPYDIVLTHGFVLDEQGRKMSKSLGNVVAPQSVIKDAGADILRLWVAASDYSEDLRIGREILKTTTDTYRKLRNTLRWMLGSLAHFRPEDRTEPSAMPELERLILHRLAELAPQIEHAYRNFDYRKVFALLAPFMTSDLSAFYFDIRKDTLYCDPLSSLSRRSCLTVLDITLDALTRWLAPILCFTAEEVWEHRAQSTQSIHLQPFPQIPAEWKNEPLARRWQTIRDIRAVVTGALEIERAAKNIGSSLEAAPILHLSLDHKKSLDGQDMAEICITSAITLTTDPAPDTAFRLESVANVAVVFVRAQGQKCARSWKISQDVGSDPEYPDVTPRDARALRELQKAGLAHVH